MSLADCHLLDLPKIQDQRGNLTFLEGERHVPFPIRRVFFLYDVPGGASRAGHALKSCEQVIISLSGAFDVVLDDGTERRRFHLNRAHFGLYVSPLTWRELDNFSSSSVCLVLASEPYDENSYLRTYDEFLAATGVAR